MSGKTNLSQMPVNSKIRSRKFLYLTFAVITICLVTVGLMNRDLIIRYYHYSKIHHFSDGDRISITDKTFKDISFKKISVYRLARPITEEDLSGSNIVDVKKSLIKQTLKSSDGLKMLLSGKVVMLDSLRKNNSFLIGTFLKKEFISVTYKNQAGTVLIYGIKIDPKIIATGNYGEDKLPANYTYADNDLYIAYSKGLYE